MRGDEVLIIIAGNKADLTDHRKVTTEEGTKLAQSLNALFFETSAKEGTNVKTLFNDLAKQLIGSDATDQEELTKKGIKLKHVEEDPDAQKESGGDPDKPNEKCNC